MGVSFARARRRNPTNQLIGAKPTDGNSHGAGGWHSRVKRLPPFPANKIFDDLIKSNLELPISPRRREEHASVQTRLQYMFVSATLCDLTACTTYQTEEQDD
ncbi:hypothetical protein Bbelb_379010 [Branchiostoma belcheri]|nr:hypothetical protein Bbelb_379010 [Branchiostoma belcheri]